MSMFRNLEKPLENGLAWNLHCEIFCECILEFLYLCSSTPVALSIKL